MAAETAEPAGDETEGARPWEVLKEEERGDFEIFRVLRLRSRSPKDGTEHDFHVAVAPDSVVVVALTGDGRMVMVEQFRHGSCEVTLEHPGGIVDEGETPDRAALRELREETGYVGERAEIIGSLRINPSWQRGSVYVALVPGARPAAEKDEDEAEETHPRLVGVDEVWRRVCSGEIRSALAIAALGLWRYGGGHGGA